MFTIQYQGVDGESKMQTLDSGNRFKLARHMLRFNHPILAIYEQSTPITKAVRSTLARMYSTDTMTAACRDFISSRD